MKRATSATRRRTRLLGLVLWSVTGVALALVALREGSGWVAALRAHDVQLADPRQLWWGALAWLVPLMSLWSLTDLPRWQQATQALLRMALIAVIAAALAGPRVHRDRPRGVQVIHVVDRSESVPDALLQRAGAAIVEGTRAVGRRDVQTDVIAFDAVAHRLPWPPTPTEDGQGEVQATLAPPDLSRRPETARETDLAAALNLALGLVDTTRVAQVVLWTDGVETRGDALSLVEPLRRAEVRVHTPALPPEATRTPAEVVVERLDVPQKLASNVPFPVSVSVRTTAPATVRCVVKGGDKPPDPVQRKLDEGLHTLDLGRLHIAKGGVHSVSVACEVLEGGDRFAQNNAIRARVLVQARPKVLYIEGARGQDVYLTRALSDDFEVEVRGPEGLPRSVAEMKPFHAIILSDVPRITPAGVPQVNTADMRNLDAWVKQGGGLLVLGGEGSLGSGGYQGTWLDKHVLPVRMEVESEVETPSIAMMLLIDRSGSMSGAKIELAKEAARATAEALGAEDRIGIIQFDNIARPLVRLQRAGNRYRIATQIAKLNASGGTHIYPALQQAYTALTGVQAKVKHVILLSDGQAPRAGIDALVRTMRSAAITVSTVGVGSEVDRGLIEAIADRGGGRFYFTDRPETLPRIFVKETKQIAGKSVVETRFQARLAAGVRRVDMLRGVAIARAPPLLGFLPTQTKKGAEELLRTSTGKPLLVRWRLGDGKVTVWTSDLKNRWAHHWIDWPDYARLARQMVRDLMSEEIGKSVQVQLSRERDRLRVAVDAIDEDDRYMRGLHASALAILPDGRQLTVALPEVAMGRYEGTVPMADFGPYEVRASLSSKPGLPALATGRATAVHPYPDELRAGDGAAVVASLVRETGGGTATGPAQWHDGRGASHQGWRWLWPDLVLLALALLLADVALRRVRLGRAPAADWFHMG